MSFLARKLTLAFAGVAGIAVLALIASAATGFSTWPWQTRQAYADGELGLRIGAAKLEVWTRIREMQREGVLVPGAGRNNDHRASTTDFTQVDTLDQWSFPTPPCCRCWLELTFADEGLASFQRRCSYAPEVP